MGEKYGPHIKDDEVYEALRAKGYSEEKSARISNAQATGHSSATVAHPGTPYEEWTRDDLYQKAKDIGIKGRSKMNKLQLIEALRTH